MSAKAATTKHLKNDTGPVKDADFKPLPGKDLRVFAEDKDVPKDAINGKIDETFVPKAEVKLPEPGKFEEWRKTLLDEIRKQSFRGFPKRIPKGELGAVKSSDSIHTTCLTEPSISCHVQGKYADQKEGPEKQVLLVWEEMRDQLEFGIWTLDVKDIRPPYWDLFPRGTSDLWIKKSPPNYVERSHALLGRTADQGRVWDIAATAHVLEEAQFKPLMTIKGKRKLKVIGYGQTGVLAAFAALFEPTITEVIIVDPPVSHRHGPIFLNVLRVLDIPEALGLLAPRPLTLISGRDEFDRTAEIYKLAGAADKFQRK